MKKTLLLIAFVLLSVVARAQTVNVHKTDGTVVTYPSSEVSYIDFTPKADDNTAPEGAEAVDLGLPSGTKWANMNVGAEMPEDYGLYFAWGETVGYGSDINDGREFNWASYKWYNGTCNTLTKYCTDSTYGTVDNKTILDLEDDAAYVNWGGDWRMPTSEEIKELKDNTTSEWTKQNGVNGRKFTSKTNGNSIFLPAAGDRWNSELYNAGSFGSYWSSTLYESIPYYAWYLDFSSGGVYTYSYYYRYFGLSVRPVLSN